MKAFTAGIIALEWAIRLGEEPTPRRLNQGRFHRHHVSDAARTLGVSQPHLWLVLHGYRSSVRLLKRYNDLVRKGGEA